MNETLAQRIAALEAQNRELQAEVAGLRPRAATAAAPPQLLGQGPRPYGDATGAHFCGQAAEPNGSAVSGSAGWDFSPYRKLGNGETVYAPDGIPRDRISGEALPMGRFAPTPEPGPQLPTRSSTHEDQVQLLDRLMQRDAERELAEQLAVQLAAERD